MIDHFITEFGHRIDFVPGYFDAHQGYREFLKKAANNRNTFTANLAKAHGPRLQYSGKNYVLTSAMLHLLNSRGLIKKWRRGIDIGGYCGNCIAIMRAAGVVQHATNLDVADYSDVTGPDYFVNYLNFMSTVASDPSEEAEFVRKQIQKTKGSFAFYDDQDLMFGLLNVPTKARAQVDEFKYVRFYEADGKYDLVTSFNVFELFDLDTALKKVSEILNPGGTFYCQDGSWWYPMNSAGFVGHFPYTLQRLSRIDLDRYLSEHHPEMKDAVLERSGFLHGGTHHPTLNDWITLGEKHGLCPVFVERVTPRTHHRTPYTPQRIFSEIEISHAEVLRDIRHLKPDVAADDLHASAYRIVMIKP